VVAPEEITRHHEWDVRDDDDIWIGGRPSPEPVVVAEYDAAWPESYELVAGQIRDALGAAVVALDHVGSTAVPGLAAKPVIDIDLTVADSADEDSYVPALEAAGFRLTIRERGWHEHRVLVLQQPRVNLHVFSPDCPETIRHAMFRDWLRAHPDDAARYVEAKVAAAADANAAGEVVMEYNERKQEVIRQIYARMFAAHGLLGTAGPDDGDLSSPS
jgi:GrpB-like predicted nucleotidyltransferase (UPF0157 family)